MSQDSLRNSPYALYACLAPIGGAVIGACFFMSLAEHGWESLAAIIGAMVGFPISSVIGISLAIISGRRDESKAFLQVSAYVLNVVGLLLGLMILPDFIH